MMGKIYQNNKKNNVFHVRVSDDFFNGINDVIEIMKKDFGEEITPSEAVRRLATYSIILIAKKYTMADVIKKLSEFNIYECPSCGRIKVSANPETCPVCNVKMVAKSKVFTPTNEMLEILDRIRLTKIIEMLE